MGKIKCPVHGDQIAGPVSIELNHAMTQKTPNNQEEVILLNLIDSNEPIIQFSVLIFEHEFVLLLEKTLLNDGLSIDEINELFIVTCGQCINDYRQKNDLVFSERNFHLNIFE
ncbi:MAG: hypothetical protein SFV55_05285 [Haliscomenobacter sp.]|uniref:hypothetical protein n=1 Tax=Haliscomenobacter sp. TaxID=2717303 RepID=UPI00299FE107|nr:hypothetical protein [Haliscomenobacter sp.]MDX2067817.1 hypothetical protein [Haliscomenobacter sp.]